MSASENWWSWLGEWRNRTWQTCAAPTGLRDSRGRSPTASAVGYGVSSLAGLVIGGLTTWRDPDWSYERLPVMEWLQRVMRLTFLRFGSMKF